MGKPWLKLWTEILYDRKLLRVAPAWRWVWVGLLCLARECEADGALLNVEGQPMDDVEAASALGVDATTWAAARDYFRRVLTDDKQGTMLQVRADGALFVTNFAARQSPDATHAARQERYRKRDAGSDASRDAGSDASQRDALTDIQKTDIQKTEDRVVVKDLVKKAATTTSARAAGKKNGVGVDVLPESWEDRGEQLVRLAAEQMIALVAPDFGNLGKWLKTVDARQAGYWGLYLNGLPLGQLERVENPAGLIRAAVKRGEWPNLSGEQIGEFKALVVRLDCGELAGGRRA